MPGQPTKILCLIHCMQSLEEEEVSMPSCHFQQSRPEHTSLSDEMKAIRFLSPVSGTLSNSIRSKKMRRVWYFSSLTHDHVLYSSP